MLTVRKTTILYEVFEDLSITTCIQDSLKSCGSQAVTLRKIKVRYMKQRNTMTIKPHIKGTYCPLLFNHIFGSNLVHDRSKKTNVILVLIYIAHSHSYYFNSFFLSKDQNTRVFSPMKGKWC